MNVEKEIAAADHRIRALINQRADDALIRLGFDPVAERAQAEAERREAALRAMEEAGRSLREQWIAIANAAKDAVAPLERLVIGLSGGSR